MTPVPKPSDNQPARAGASLPNPAPLRAGEKATDLQIREWADRHDLQGTLTDLRCTFEDAASLIETPAAPSEVGGLGARDVKDLGSKTPDTKSTTTAEGIESLLPCPFCEKAIEIVKCSSAVNNALRWRPECVNEECFFYDSTFPSFGTKKEAIRSWNARKPLSQVPKVASPPSVSGEAEGEKDL